MYTLADRSPGCALINVLVVLKSPVGTRKELVANAELVSAVASAIKSKTMIMGNPHLFAAKLRYKAKPYPCASFEATASTPATTRIPHRAFEVETAEEASKQLLASADFIHIADEMLPHG